MLPALTLRTMLVILFVFTGYSKIAHAGDLAELINYREYSETLSSAGQPTEKQLQVVKEADFERVVYLAFSDHHDSLPTEDRMVKDLGMEYVHLPIDWDLPTVNDYTMFAGAMLASPDKKTLVHCQVNFRASSLSFLYRVLQEEVPMDQALEDLNTVWVPNETWKKLIFDVLEKNGRSPHCDACLWE